MKAGRIDVTGAPLEAMVRAAYNPSRPQGLGALAYRHGDLTDAEVSEIIERGKRSTFQPISMDYVNGRSCKFHVQKDGDVLWINNRWYDHSDADLRHLLESVGLKADLLDKARAAEAAYLKAIISEAVEYIKTNGGRFVELDSDRRAGKELPERLFDGLVYGGEDGPIVARWTDKGREYTLAENVIG